MKLAYGNFMASYHLDDPKLVFITLMMSLEILFNQSTTELRYRVSRSVAVLLGKSRNKSEKIAKDLRGLYDIRSKIVHTGECDDLEKQKIVLLRNYVRKCLLKLFALGIKKDELITLLNELGYGDFSPKLLSIKHKKVFNRIKYFPYL
jgi:hypothetical protein